MQLFSFFERRRSTSNARPAKIEAQDATVPLKTSNRSSTLMRSASLLKAKLRGTGKKSTNSPSESGRPVSYCDNKKDLIPRSRYSGSFIEESRPKRKSSLKRLLRHLRSSSSRTCDEEELTELAYLLELKETESIQSVTAKRKTQVCQGSYRHSREVEIIDPYMAGTMDHSWRDSIYSR